MVGLVEQCTFDIYWEFPYEVPNRLRGSPFCASTACTGLLLNLTRPVELLRCILVIERSFTGISEERNILYSMFRCILFYAYLKSMHIG